MGLLILEELLHLLVKPLQLLGCELTKVFSTRRHRLAKAASAAAVKQVKKLVPSLLGYTKINCLLNPIGVIVARYNWAVFWPMFVAAHR